MYTCMLANVYYVKYISMFIYIYIYIYISIVYVYISADLSRASSV